MGSGFVSERQIIGSTRGVHYGVTKTTQLRLQEVTIAAAWNLQGDPTDPLFLEEVQSMFDISLPTTPNMCQERKLVTSMWLGPTSWLLVAGGPLSATHPLTRFSEKRNAVNAARGALFDVSSSRVALKIAGPHSSTVLASGCPLDFHPRVFVNRTCAQSLFGHVGVLVFRGADGSFTLFVARSFARDVWSSLCSASAQHGYDVVAPTSFGPQ
jgi:sarcosine oxidase subunit gamma